MDVPSPYASADQPTLRDRAWTFGWDLERFVFFDGYPGAAPLIDDPPRWSNYILDSLSAVTDGRCGR